MVGLYATNRNAARVQAISCSPCKRFVCAMLTIKLVWVSCCLQLGRHTKRQKAVQLSIATFEDRSWFCRTVRTSIGAFAAPDVIHFTPSLPKTRSGKIMRRILRKIASGELDQLGDTSTLADPNVVDQLIETKGK